MTLGTTLARFSADARGPEGPQHNRDEIWKLKTRTGNNIVHPHPSSSRLGHPNLGGAWFAAWVGMATSSGQQDGTTSTPPQLPRSRAARCGRQVLVASARRTGRGCQQSASGERHCPWDIAPSASAAPSCGRSSSLLPDRLGRCMHLHGVLPAPISAEQRPRRAPAGAATHGDQSSHASGPHGCRTLESQVRKPLHGHRHRAQLVQQWSHQRRRPKHVLHQVARVPRTVIQQIRCELSMLRSLQLAEPLRVCPSRLQGGIQGSAPLDDRLGQARLLVYLVVVPHAPTHR
eukprot:1763668-Pyramimonas_sp.AAC.1